MSHQWTGNETFEPREPRAVLGSGETRPRKATPLWVCFLGAAGCVAFCLLIAWLNTLAVTK